MADFERHFWEGCEPLVPFDEYDESEIVALLVGRVPFGVAKRVVWIAKRMANDAAGGLPG